MFGLNRWNRIDDMFTFQREFDRLFNQLWSDLPARTAQVPSSAFQVHTNNDGWRIDVPLPGIDPHNVNLEVAGNTLTIRAEEPAGRDAEPFRYEQTMKVPEFLDIEKITASHRHGMLQLTLPVKDAVKPRRIEIEGIKDGQKRIAA